MKQSWRSLAWEFSSLHKVTSEQYIKLFLSSLNIYRQIIHEINAHPTRQLFMLAASCKEHNFHQENMHLDGFTFTNIK